MYLLYPKLLPKLGVIRVRFDPCPLLLIAGTEIFPSDFCRKPMCYYLPTTILNGGR